MDCEKFESLMLDELYGELDELTSAAVRRHAEGCARCSARMAALRATRRVVGLPLVETPAGLEERIFAAARDAQKVVPLRLRAAHAISLAGSWAMRPQTAMAAVFLVMIGTSVLLLRGKAHAPTTAPVTVTEQGTPAPPVAAPPTPLTLQDRSSTAAVSKAPPSRAAAREDEFASPPSVASPAARAAPVGAAGGVRSTSAGGAAYGSPQARDDVSMFDAAQARYRAAQFDEAAREFDALSSNDPNAELWAARSVRAGKGCRAAAARFDHLSQRAAGTAPGWDALLEGALCYRAVGNFSEARVRLNALLHVDSHKDRAQAELDRIDQIQAQSDGTAASSKAGTRGKAASTPAASPPAAGAPVLP